MKFKCKHTGCIYEFGETDIKTMLAHEDYEVVKDEPAPEVKSDKVKKFNVKE